MLTTGDVEKEGEQEIISSGILAVVAGNDQSKADEPDLSCKLSDRDDQAYMSDSPDSSYVSTDSESGKNKKFHLKDHMGSSDNQDYSLNNSIDVLKVAHHGSSGSSSLNLLSRITPRVSLISVGEGNRYGHPHAETLERLEKVGTSIYRTDQSGAIIVSVDGADMKLREYVK